MELLIFIQIDKFLENCTEHHNRLGWAVIMLITIEAVSPERPADCFVMFWKPSCQASLLCSNSYIIFKALDLLYFIMSTKRKKQNLRIILRNDLRMFCSTTIWVLLIFGLDAGSCWASHGAAHGYLRIIGCCGQDPLWTTAVQ